MNITILEHEAAVYVSTSFNEIVTCRMADGSLRRLLLKRGAAPKGATCGHRGGVPYEAEVYRRVLGPLGVSTPTFHSATVNPITGETTLLIDFFDDAMRLNKVSRAAPAARWIGKFHRLNEPRVSSLDPLLKRYDVAYYLGWPQRALNFSPEASRPELEELAREFETLSAELLSGPATIIHGEYYPANILVREQTIYPVDWESAAIAAGEIDLASVTEGWPEEDKQASRAEYCAARWPAGAPAGFERRLAIAEIYLAFRWMGDRPEWAKGKIAESYLQRLRDARERLGSAPPASDLDPSRSGATWPECTFKSRQAS